MDERPEIREEKEDEDEIGEDGLEVQVRTRRSSVFFWVLAFGASWDASCTGEATLPDPSTCSEITLNHPSITWSLAKGHLVTFIL